jgi:hypothetical protein
VPGAILTKPGALTASEFAVVRQHPARGAEIVAEALSPEQVSWVRGHHERFDGTGYPAGLAGDDIPDGARFAPEVVAALRSLCDQGAVPHVVLKPALEPAAPLVYRGVEAVPVPRRDRRPVAGPGLVYRGPRLPTEDPGSDTPSGGDRAPIPPSRLRAAAGASAPCPR